MCPVCMFSSAAAIVTGLTSAGGIGAFTINKARVRALVTGSGWRMKPGSPNGQKLNSTSLRTRAERKCH